MSNYLGIPDSIPQLVPFDPSLNYYAGVLSEKQNQYDQNLKKVNSIYGSVFNSPLSRADNQSRRDQYFKTIESDVQKIAQMDLSIDQNVSTAKDLFSPILQDKYLVNDIIYTKRLGKAYQNAEEYRNCVDPIKCNGSYWDEGVQALNYASEEFRNAGADEALRMQAPSYVPYQNVTSKAIKAAKDFGFNIQYDHIEGRYLVTDSNGQLLLGKDGNGILPQFLYGMFGNDGSVQKMYDTKAYVQRKGYSKQRAVELGITESAAEAEYINNILPKTITKLNQSTRDLENLKAKTNADKTSLDILVQQQGGVVEGDGIQDQYGRLEQLILQSEQSQKYHDQVNNLINASPNSNDIRLMRNRADNLVAQSLFQGDMLNAAYEYAMGTSKHEIKGADPYALAAYNNSLDLNKAMTLKNMDQRYWIEQNVLEGKIDPNDANTFGYNVPTGLNVSGLGGGGNSESALRRQVMQALSSGQLNQEELLNMGITKLDSPALEKIAQAGLFNKSNATVTDNLAGPPLESTPFQNTYFENAKVLAAATDNAVAKSTSFLKSTINAMRKAYDNADAAWGKDAVGVKTKILLDAKDILQGTGINYNDIINGNAPLSVFDRVKPQTLSAMTDMAMNVKNKGISSQVYNAGWSDIELADMQRANQTMTGLYKERTRDLQNALDNVLADNTAKLNNRDIDLNQAKMTAGLYTSIVADDVLLPYTTAKDKFLKENLNNFGRIYDINNVRSPQEDEFVSRNNAEVLRKAETFFDANYTNASKTINDKLTSFNSRTGSADQGGMEFTKNAVSITADAAKPLDRNFREVAEVVRGIKNNPEGMNPVFFGSGLKDVSEVQTSSEKAELFDIINDVVNSGNKKVKVNMTMQDLPAWLNQSPFSTENSLNEAVQKNPGNTEVLPGQFHEEAVLVGLTLDEDTYRDKKGLKKSDVVDQSMRTVWVKTPAVSPAVSPFLSRIRKSPEDIYMQREGAVQSIDLGSKGSAAIETHRDGFYLQLNIPYFNHASGRMETIKMQPRNISVNTKGENVPLNVSEAFKIAVGDLNTAHIKNQSLIQTYLKK